jgi:ATP-dependent exoDNAse (exonuclease V) alpha subunit
VFARRGGGARQLVESGGIVAAAFDHRTSRAGDPLLHTHVVTANMTSTTDRAGGVVWRTIAGAGLFEHAKAGGCLYQAHLRHVLTGRLGVEFEAVINGHADIIGVPKAAIGVFSKRRGEITEMLTESATTSREARQIATLQTRKAKDYGVDVDTLEAKWRTEAAEVGFDAEHVLTCFGRVRSAELSEEHVESLMAILGSRYGLTERAATFTRTTVIQSIASAVGSHCTARQIEELADRFLASDRALLVDRSPLVEVGGGDDVQRDPQRVAQRASVRRSSTQKLYTTPELAALEEQLLAAAVKARRGPLPVPVDVVDAVIGERPELSVEQQEMIRAACHASVVVLPVAGRPGAGKTYATEAVVAAHVAAGVAIIGCSVSATAAAELEHAAGFARSTGAPASTVARLLRDLDGPYGGLRPGTVVVVDEASMIGTRDLARLVAAARTADGVVVLIGDPDQHGAVDVGGVFRRLCADSGDRLVTLVDNNRQQDHSERLAVAEYRDGRIDEALARYDQAGNIIRSRTAGESFDAMVADWYAARIHGRTDPMIAGPNSTRRALNERARTLLAANGELTGPVLKVAGREFQAGDEVVARRNDRALHQPGSREFVKNGSAGIVSEVDGEQLVVRFDREGPIAIPAGYLQAGHLEHGYARTTYGVQGATQDVARYHATDMSSFEEGYVAITRGRNAARIYIVDGTLPARDNDLTHQRVEAPSFGVEELATALARRRAGHMAADLSGNLTAVASTLAGHNLAQLAQRRHQVARMLAGAPPDVTDVIADTRRTTDALRERRQACIATIDHAPEPSNANRVDSADSLRRARSAVGHIDRNIAIHEHKLDVLLQAQTQRQTWAVEHAEPIIESDILRRAEHARETQIRTAAIHRVPESVTRLVGREPSTQHDRRIWQRAVEDTAVYHDRHHPLPGHRDGIESVIGERPHDPRAAIEYKDLAAILKQAHDIERAAERSIGMEL